MKIKCPSCSTVLSIPASAAGKLVKCPCGKQLKAPAGAATAPTQPAATSAGGLDGNVWDELTDNDLKPVATAAPPNVAAPPKRTKKGKLKPYVPPDDHRRSSSSQVMDGYGAALVGMRLVFFAWIALVCGLIFSYAFSWLARLSPAAVRTIVQTIGEAAFGWIMLGVAGTTLVSLGMVFVGQIVCIFSPKKDEKLFAGLAVGALVGGILLPIIALLFGVFAINIAGGPPEPGDGGGRAAAVAIGLGMILVIVFSYLLILSNMFFFITYFRRVGKNIRSVEVREAANVAMITWIVALGTAIVCVVALVILAAIFRGEQEKMRIVGDIVGVINVLLTFSVIGTLIAMSKTTIDKICGR